MCICSPVATEGNFGGLIIPKQSSKPPQIVIWNKYVSGIFVKFEYKASPPIDDFGFKQAAHDMRWGSGGEVCLWVDGDNATNKSFYWYRSFKLAFQTGCRGAV